MKIDWADEVANNHEHHLNVALWQTGISQRDFAAICNWAASIVLSRVEEGAKAIRRKKLIGRSTANGVFCVADTKTDKNGQYVLYDDVLSLLESMKQNTNGDQG